MRRSGTATALSKTALLQKQGDIENVYRIEDSGQYIIIVIIIQIIFTKTTAYLLTGSKLFNKQITASFKWQQHILK